MYFWVLLGSVATLILSYSENHDLNLQTLRNVVKARGAAPPESKPHLVYTRPKEHRICLTIHSLLDTWSKLALTPTN